MPWSARTEIKLIGSLVEELFRDPEESSVKKVDFRLGRAEVEGWSGAGFGAAKAWSIGW
jgi:hypothetical protein